jgi:hypothetical protein
MSERERERERERNVSYLANQLRCSSTCASIECTDLQSPNLPAYDYNILMNTHQTTTTTTTTHPKNNNNNNNNKPKHTEIVYQ